MLSTLRNKRGLDLAIEARVVFVLSDRSPELDMSLSAESEDQSLIAMPS